MAAFVAGLRSISQLLGEDPALNRFKSYKNSLKRVSKVGDALTILVAACTYELYAVAKEHPSTK